MEPSKNNKQNRSRTKTLKYNLKMLRTRAQAIADQLRRTMNVLAHVSNNNNANHLYNQNRKYNFLLRIIQNLHHQV